ncbi:hypothetical protein AUW17_11565 [Tenacibaculum dicentrarchi]|nr:hypothetical protein AUW17_11565 [Tenacibaculum dicentrarchi]
MGVPLQVALSLLAFFIFLKRKNKKELKHAIQSLTQFPSKIFTLKLNKLLKNNASYLTISL